MGQGLNCVMLLGYLGADVELRVTQGGQSVLSLRLAVSESYLDKDKVRREKTEWINVTVWGRRADALAKILVKGSQVFIEGSLHTSSYDDRDGNKRYKVEVVAKEVILTGRSGGQGDDAGDGGGEYDAQPARGGAPRGGGGGGRPAGRSGGGGREVDVCHFGRNKGTRFADCDERDLYWYRDALEGNIGDPNKARYRAEAEAALKALDDVLRSRGVEPGPRPSGGYSGGRGGGAPPPAQSAGGDDGGYGDGGGYGEPGEGGYDGDDIPFASCNPALDLAWMRVRVI